MVVSESTWMPQQGRRQLASTMQARMLERLRCKAVPTIESHQPSPVSVLYTLPPGSVAPLPSAQLHILDTLIRLLRIVQPQTLGTRLALHLSYM